MKVGKILSIAIVSALLVACSSSGGSNARPSGPPSLSSVPEQYRSTVSKAKTIDLVEEDNGDIYSFVINGKATGEYNFSDLPNGRADLSFSSSLKTAQGETTAYSGAMLVYQQPYSVVTGVTLTQSSGDQFDIDNLNIFQTGEALGFSTTIPALTALIAQNASFEYKGRAFDGKEEATLNYTMNFGSQEGHGSITGFSRTGLITLGPSILDNDWAIHGEADIEKDSRRKFAVYNLFFSVPKRKRLLERYMTTPKMAMASSAGVTSSLPGRSAEELTERL